MLNVLPVPFRTTHIPPQFIILLTNKKFRHSLLIKNADCDECQLVFRFFWEENQDSKGRGICNGFKFQARPGVVVFLDCTKRVAERKRSGLQQR